MKTIRYNTFETNSSSTHALAIHTGRRSVKEFPVPDEHGSLWICLNKYFSAVGQFDEVSDGNGYMTGDLVYIGDIKEDSKVGMHIMYLVTLAVCSAIDANSTWNSKDRITEYDYDKAERSMLRNLSVLKRKIISPVYSDLGLPEVKRIIPYYVKRNRLIKIDSSTMPNLDKMQIGITEDEILLPKFAASLHTDINTKWHILFSEKTTLTEAVKISDAIDNLYVKSNANHSRKEIKQYGKEIDELRFKLWRTALLHNTIQRIYHT